LNRYRTIAASTLNGFRNLTFRRMNLLRPKWLWLEVTDACNSRCVLCDIWHKSWTTNPLSPKELEIILSDPLFRDVTYVLNSGGEPTVRRDLKEILLAEHRALPKARLQLSTNGILADRAIDAVKYVMELGASLDVGVSLDGVGEQHDQIRGVKGNFRLVDELLQQLTKLRCRYPERLSVTAGSTLSNLTVGHANETKDYSQRLNVPFMFHWYNESSFYENTGKNLASDREAMIGVVRKLPRSLYRDTWIDWLNGRPLDFPCFAMHTFCVLKCNGDIVPCLTHWDKIAGNVRKKTPWEIWHSESANEVRRIVHNCEGCLNSWGFGWSVDSSYYQKLNYRLRKRLPSFGLKQIED